MAKYQQPEGVWENRFILEIARKSQKKIVDAKPQQEALEASDETKNADENNQAWFT